MECVWMVHWDPPYLLLLHGFGIIRYHACLSGAGYSFSHHITSHHITSYHITSHHITSYITSCVLITATVAVWKMNDNWTFTHYSTIDIWPGETSTNHFGALLSMLLSLLLTQVLKQFILTSDWLIGANVHVFFMDTYDNVLACCHENGFVTIHDVSVRHTQRHIRSYTHPSWILHAFFQP